MAPEKFFRPADAWIETENSIKGYGKIKIQRTAAGSEPCSYRNPGALSRITRPSVPTPVAVSNPYIMASGFFVLFTPRWEIFPLLQASGQLGHGPPRGPQQMYGGERAQGHVQAAPEKRKNHIFFRLSA